MAMIFPSHANKTYFHNKVVHLASFEREGFWNLEVAGLFESFLFFLPILAGPSPGILLPENAQMLYVEIL